MFPSQQSDDQQVQHIPQASLQKGNPIIGNTVKHRKPSHVTENEVGDHQGLITTRDDKDKKQLLREEIQRQRRQQMSSLYASLRSLLPLEYIKGKRSVSDHLNGAGIYIKHLKKKVKDFDVKRKQLRVSNIFALSSGTESSNQRFIIQPCLNGFEIMFRCGFEEKGLSLSEVLAILVDEGLSVVSCVSTKFEEFLLHTIQIEVSDPPIINQSELPSCTADGPPEDKITHEDKLAWFFVAINFILEIPSLALDQLVSTKHPYYALTVMLISALTLMICILELIWKAKRGRYILETKGRYGNRIPWFYCPRTNKPLGTLWEFIGFASGFSQLIIIAINYSFIRQRLDCPIKISMLPLILAFGLLCCKFLEQSNNLRGRNRATQRGANTNTIALHDIRVG